MRERPNDLRDRQARLGDLPNEGQAVAPHQAAAPPARASRWRSRAMVTALLLGIAAGGAISAIPRAEQRVRQEVTTPGVIPKQVEQMDMIEASRGYPFQTWSLTTGPADAAVRTTAHININARGIAFNLLITTLGALLIGAVVTRRRD